MIAFLGIEPIRLGEIIGYVRIANFRSQIGPIGHASAIRIWKRFRSDHQRSAIYLPLVDQRPARRKSERGQTARFCILPWGWSNQVLKPYHSPGVEPER
jgi:hypothetical protein